MRYLVFPRQQIGERVHVLQHQPLFRFFLFIVGPKCQNIIAQSHCKCLL